VFGKACFGCYGIRWRNIIYRELYVELHFDCSQPDGSLPVKIFSFQQRFRKRDKLVAIFMAPQGEESFAARVLPNFMAAF
jgi:hypothetical protein